MTRATETRCERLHRLAQMAMDRYTALRAVNDEAWQSPDVTRSEMYAIRVQLAAARRRTNRLCVLARHAARDECMAMLAPQPAEKAVSAPRGDYAYGITLDTPRLPDAALRRGRGHRHVWQTWGDDERYERCPACGETRTVATKQASLF